MNQFSHALQIRDLNVCLNNGPVISNFSVTVPTQKLIALVGPNGAGKSTLLSAIVGLTQIQSGSISILGQSIDAVRSRIAYVPQRLSVDWDFPATVLDVVLMGSYGRLGWFSRPGNAEIVQAYEALQQLQIVNFAHRHIGQLSGGQQQRVFLARALMQQAEFYLMDEPFAGVDAVTERVVIDFLKGLRDQGKTVLIVHHDLQTLAEYFDWVILMNVHSIASGPIEEVLKPEYVCQAYGNRTIYQTFK